MATGLEVVMLLKGSVPSLVCGFHKKVVEPLKLLRIWASILEKAYSYLVLALYVNGASGLPLDNRGEATNCPVEKFELVIELMKFDTRVVR